jgi:thymidylate synthase (FAD)
MRAEYVNHMGTDLTVVNAARVSFDKESKPHYVKGEATVSDGDKKLITYLAKHNHWTPFAHPQITLRMRAPIPIRTQCFKHKQGFVENEESRRYISSRPTYSIPYFRYSAENKKQGSGDELPPKIQGLEQAAYVSHMEESIKKYETALEHGVCEEQARFYLPQGVDVNWYWTGSLAAFARFCKQRGGDDAQGEVQQLAKQVGRVIKPLFPVCWIALMGE